MRVAIVGCAHGELNRIYQVLESMENESKLKTDLLLCCGDFQAVRDEYDLKSMVRSRDYHDLGEFRKYYNGESTAPVLTLFVGGNHEASNYLQELPFGGWVAENIYYLGYAGCLNVNGLRIAGISGIYKKYNYRKGHYEIPPFIDESSKRSVYHVRELEVFRLKQLSNKIDVCLSHDWPRNVDKFGDEMTSTQLVAMKPRFEQDIENDRLGSRANKEILERLKPLYWFAGHLHCRFSAVVPHSGDTKTKFLALGNAVVNEEDGKDRKFLEIIDIDVEVELNDECRLSYDLEWLTILHLTQHLVTGKKRYTRMPFENGPTRWNFTPTTEEMECVLTKFDNDLTVPMNFGRKTEGKSSAESQPMSNPQTVKFCSTLGIDDPLRVAMMAAGKTWNPEVTVAKISQNMLFTLLMLSCIPLICVAQEIIVRRDDQWPPISFTNQIIEVTTSCRNTTGIDVELIKRFSDKDAHDHPELKCYMKCVMFRLNAMDEKGNINALPAMEMLKKTDKWIQDIFINMGKNCVRIKFPKNIDLCEKAFMINKCLKESDPVHYFMI